MKDLGAALEQAKKASISDARKRALRLFGEYLGNSCYDKEHIKDVAANRANQSNLQSPTAIKIENGHTNMASTGTPHTPPLHPPPRRLPPTTTTTPSAPQFQPPPRTPAVSGGIVPPAGSNNVGHTPPVPMGHGSTNPVNSYGLTTPNNSHPSLPHRPAVPPPNPVIKAEPKSIPFPPTRAADSSSRGQQMVAPPVHSWSHQPPPAPGYSNTGNHQQGAGTMHPSSSATYVDSASAKSIPRGGGGGGTTFHRPLPTNTLSSPSMPHPPRFQDDSASTNRKRALDVYGNTSTTTTSSTTTTNDDGAVDDLDGLRLSQFEFDDGATTNSKKARS
ncbi:hypothetical protein, variant [Aphanomyces astaci]|nr:hypothetical protein, variant [Aphanomyces astaci]ETV78855.1 hypothetical protein, variant [Aphanomyces astaci]|eukprot:XP_009831574.1 hypothetical protein, variant [Aphanomyces astaci]